MQVDVPCWCLVCASCRAHVAAVCIVRTGRSQSKGGKRMPAERLLVVQPSSVFGMLEVDAFVA